MTGETTMVAVVEEYLASRRKLGFTLRSAGEELLLFGRYADESGHSGPITTDLIVRWAKLPTSATPMYWAWRFEVVRLFARHRVFNDPQTEVPSRGLLGRSFRRGQPHIYSTEEVVELIRAARALDREMPSETYATLFGLLASTGLRVGEALGLRRAHVDLDHGVLTIVKSKAEKMRFVPLHPSTTEVLRRYAAVRDRICTQPKSDAFFLTFRWTGLTYQNVTRTFRTLRRQMGWSTRASGAIPRIHDLRHTFAVRVLLRWYEAGANVDEKITSLATYLGHVNPTSTYWYLTAVPELMAVTASRFEQFAGGM